MRGNRNVHWRAIAKEQTIVLEIYDALHDPGMPPW
jgi:hypothetical protein